MKATTLSQLPGKRILLANASFDGHFGPLTGIAVYLQRLGHDVRWYCSSIFEDKVKALGIPYYPLVQALDANAVNLNEIFPERTKIKSQIARLKFDMVHYFIDRAPEYGADIAEIRKSFPFDVMICDSAFSGIPFVADKMDVPVISIGVLPLTETSKDLPPAGLGLTPSTSFLGRLKQDLLRKMADRFFWKEPNARLHEVLGEHGIDGGNDSIFDILLHKSALHLQSGTPSFEYQRSDLGKNVRFIGPLLPHRPKSDKPSWYDDRLTEYQKIVVVTQGTVEKDPRKLLIPTLKGLKDQKNILLVVTTGGSGTEALRKQFPQRNIIIEDYIPFGDIMPYADVYVTNGGYGGTLLGIEHKLPLVVAGVHEGKNEIAARVGYFGLGVNLKTETPAPSQVAKAVLRVLNDGSFRENVTRLGNEFSRYRPYELCAKYMEEVLAGRAAARKQVKAGVVMPPATAW